jgi:uncharacterized membrane protein
VPIVAAATNVALYCHLLGAFLLVAGTVVAGTAFEAARRRRRPSEIALLLGLARVGVVLVGAGSLVALAFGLWLVHLEHVGYGATWVDAAFGLLVLVGALGGAGGQIPKRARELAERLGEGESSAELRALLDDRAARALNYCAGALLLAIVALMVFKPGGPT